MHSRLPAPNSLKSDRWYGLYADDEEVCGAQLVGQLETEPPPDLASRGELTA